MPIAIEAKAPSEAEWSRATSFRRVIDIGGVLEAVRFWLCDGSEGARSAIATMYSVYGRPIQVLAGGRETFDGQVRRRSQIKAYLERTDSPRLRSGQTGEAVEHAPRPKIVATDL